MQASFDISPPTFNDCKKKVFAVPEAIAGLASYLVSLRRQKGLHAMIDLGSGTADISICNLSISLGESTSYWYASRNIPRGTINIERIVADFIKGCQNGSSCNHSNVVSFLNVFCGNQHDGLNEDLLYKIKKEILKIKESDAYRQIWGKAYSHLLYEEHRNAYNTLCKIL